MIGYAVSPDSSEAAASVSPEAPAVNSFQRQKNKPEAAPLTSREVAFVHEYMKDMNATAALVRLNRGGQYPGRRAAEHLARPNVRKAIREAVERQVQACRMSIEDIEAAYVEVARAHASGPVLHSHKLQALDALAKIRGMFKPETQTVVPVQFIFQGMPDSASGTITINANPSPDAATASHSQIIPLSGTRTLPPK